MSNKLFSLFDEKLRSPGELVAGPTQNLDSIGDQVVDSDAMLRKIQQFEIVRPKVDYSDFENFVFFNSALDYFNITGEKILNEYPYDGTDDEVEHFTSALDDYQRYVLRVWPKTNKGHLRFNPASGFAHIRIDDVGLEDGITKTSMISPGTGSFAVEFWAVPPPALTGSNDVMVVAQKLSGTDGFTIFYSGSSVYMNVSSGSATDSVSSPCSAGQVQYFCFSYDRSSTYPIITSFSGSADNFPVTVSSATGSIIGSVLAGTSRFTIASGSVASKTVRPLSGSLDDVRLWKTTRTLSDLSSSFNTRISAQDGLYGLWRFNESGSLSNPSENAIVRDHSGHKLHGTVTNYFTALRSSGSILPFDADDLIVTFDAPEVQTYIAQQQASGTLYDRLNDNIISKLLPEQFFLLEEFKNTNVLLNFLYVLGRQFDQIKVSIDQFVHVLSSNYGPHNQAPDALLQDVARFFGWEFTGNFLDANVVQYLLGKQVLTNTRNNKALDVKLYEIKNEFWKRTLINLMHLYKTKGTRESVETLLRIYGVNQNFVRLKEYGLKPNSGIKTFRIFSQKSVPALTFGSGSATNSVLTSSLFTSNVQSVETRLRFPTQTSAGLTATLATGSIWTIVSSSLSDPIQSLYYEKASASTMTGNLVYTGSEGRLSLSNVPIFDNRWYSVAVNRDPLSSSLSIDVRLVERDEIIYSVTSSLSTAISSGSRPNFFKLGMTQSTGSQFWVQEVKLWNEGLTETELNDHALNFQSYGKDTPDGIDNLILHWRLDENVSTTGTTLSGIYDHSGNARSGSGGSWPSDLNVYRKFLCDYNYIASPDHGWNEEKIRAIADSKVTPAEAFRDNSLISLEFNLVDALNEDISQIISTLDNWNEYIGAPVNRYRETYHELDVLRSNYFKRLNGYTNFRVFADVLEFFDRSFIDMIKRLIPARAIFLGDEFVVESHMLERPKFQWNYRRKEPDFQPEGRITVYVRT